ncbi:hypothetical protein [Bacillus mycoides]|uniref:hypothetical protein n=1 Tax=Bacillus mycoides TaxID=1405 RepID=UPI00273BFBFF|nr:hypothetical protein [Bacillus mycoides]
MYHEYYRLRTSTKAENEMITIPIIERVFEVNGKIQFEVIGEKEIPIAWLEKE